MRREILLLFILMLLAYANLFAQQYFIRTNNNQNFGQSVRIIPVEDNGWVVFSTDSLKMLRYDRCGQPVFGKVFNLQRSATGKIDLTPLSNNGCAILTESDTGGTISPVLTMIDSSGSVIWSKKLSGVADTTYACSVSSDNSGFIYLVSANYSDTTNGVAVTKFDLAGTIVEDYYIDKQSRDADMILTKDGGKLIRSGNCFTKLNPGGLVQWSVTIENPAVNFSKPIEAGNGYLVSANLANSNFISLIKIGLNGNIVVRKRTDFRGIPPKIMNLPSSNFGAMFHREVSDVYYPTMVEVDSNLNIVSQHSIGFNSLNNSLRVQDATIGKNNLPLIAGATTPYGAMFFGRTNEFFYTGCDTTLAMVQTSSVNVSQTSVSTTVVSALHNVTDVFAGITNYSDSDIVLCTVPVALTIGGDTLICTNKPAGLANATSDYFEKYFWSTGDTTTTLIVDQPGEFWLMGIGQCSQDTLYDTIQVTKKETIPFELGDDRYRCEGNTIVLNGPDCDNCIYLWNDGSMGQVKSVRNYGKQWLRVDNEGCISTDTIFVQNAKCECQFYLPNSITPNQDGVNDLLKPAYYCDIRNYSMSIFNRWGELIFNTDNVEQAWDGRIYNLPVPQGVYVYVVTFTSLMEGVDNEVITKTGSVAVVY